MATSKIKGVLVDVDGTLLDSNDAHARSWVDALSSFGHSHAFEEIRPLIGMGADQLLPKLRLDPGSPRGEAIAALRSLLFREHYLPSLEPLPGARGLIETMKEDGLTLVVATSASREELPSLLERARVSDLLTEATSSDDAEKSKPAPDIVEAALARSGHPASEVVLLGDTPYDVAAGVRAGVRVVAVRSGGWSDEALAGALAIYDDAAAIVAQYRETVFGSRGAAPSPRGVGSS